MPTVASTRVWVTAQAAATGAASTAASSSIPARRARAPAPWRTTRTSTPGARTPTTLLGTGDRALQHGQQRLRVQPTEEHLVRVDDGDGRRGGGLEGGQGLLHRLVGGQRGRPLGHVAGVVPIG